MSWSTEDHELYLASAFADGWTGATYSGDKVVATRDADGRDVAYEEWQPRPEADVVGWHVTCNCTDPRTPRGYRVEVLARWARVASPALEDVAAGRIYVTPEDGPIAASDRDDVVTLMHQLWDAHRAPADALHALEDAWADARRAADAVDRAVVAGRAAGLSWADVGRATGMTRQSARERWLTEDWCACGKPAEHVHAPEDSADWACRVPV